MQKRVLVIEDEEDIGNLIHLHLSDLGFLVDLCHEGVSGFEKALKNDYDVIILDLMLPGKDGLSICSDLRQKQCKAPILMLTARNSETDRVVGLEIGADDYLTKPFSIRELQARVKAIVRRIDLLSEQQKIQSEQGEVLRYSGITLDTSKREVIVYGDLIELTSTEFDLLHYLAKQPGRVFSRAQLLDEVWGYHHTGYEHTVNSHINRLRTKLEKDPSKPRFVQTVWGVGYKFLDV